MSLPDFLSLEEKRILLEHVRVKFGFEANIPRELSIDKIVEKGMATSTAEVPFSLDCITEQLAGRKLPLRRTEVQRAIDRLCQSNRVERVVKDRRAFYCLAPSSARDINREIAEANARINRVVNRLYAGVPVDPGKLRKFFLKFLSDAFARFSREWVDVAIGKARMAEVFVQDETKNLLENAAKYSALEKKARNTTYDRTLKFFGHDDPDYNMLKYIIGQSCFIARLLALDIPFDQLSTELFSDGTLFLDTNVVIVALLPGASRFNAFREALGICKRLGINLVVLEPTLRETLSVVAYEQTEVAPLYEQVPPKLVEKTKGQFYQTYCTQKAADPSFTVADVFKPFADLRGSLAGKYNIDVWDDRAFDSLAHDERLPKLKRILAGKSLEVRRRKKAEAALQHDAIICLYIDQTRADSEVKRRFLTLDRSLPSATSEMFAAESSMAITLDGFLQTLSPFVSTDRDLDFASVFAQLIEAQILPQDQIYDIRDYLIFHDMGMNCQTMPASEVDEALGLLKTKVLRGDHYTRENFERASYEFKRFFTQRYAKKEELLAHKEAEIRELKQKHEEEIKNLRGESDKRFEEVEKAFREKEKLQADEIASLRSSLTQVQGQIARGRLKWLKFLKILKWLSVGVWVAGGLYGATRLALMYGQGPNGLEKVKDFWFLYVLVVAVAEVLIKWLLPQHDFLSRIFKAISGKGS
jgi:hypothetical protein